jgi:hypothetical protein
VADDQSIHIAGIENTGEFLKRNEEDPEVCYRSRQLRVWRPGYLQAVV